MPGYTTADLRNVAFTGHAGAGKTTLIEAILHHKQLTGRLGTVEEGTTVCDFEPEEKEHQHSLNAAFVHFEHEGRQVTLADSPGFPDMIGQALTVFPAVETVACVIGADKGVQTMTRRVMEIAKMRDLPRIIIVNKISDHAGELEALLESIRETFGSECMPINLPNAGGTDVVDLWEKSDGEVAFSSVAEGHAAIVDQCVEADEKLMEIYLEQGSLTPEQLHEAFEAALRQGHLIPVCFVSAKTLVGMDALLHTIANLCPSPLEGNPRPFLHKESDDAPDEVWHADPDASKTPVAHVFKVTTDQFVGKLSMLRVHQGTIEAGTTLHMDGVKKPIKIAHPLRVHGKDHEEIKKAIPGDIIAVAKVEELRTGAVLHGPDIDHLTFKPIEMPRPMYGVAIEAKSHGDEAKISSALHKIIEEDPTIRLDRIKATRETVLSAMGELHMRVLLEKLHNRFKADIETRPPKVAYKETITAKAEGHHRHKKQTGGAGQFGEVYLRVEPINGQAAGEGQHAKVLTDEEHFQFIDETVGGSVPRQFLPAIEKGIRQAMEHGAVAGYPLGGVRVSVYDGKHHAVDSKEIAFVTAGKRAFIDAVNKARPALMEPIVDLEVTAPATAMGDITSDLSGKRGHVEDTAYLPGDMVLIKAKVPLSEMQNYSGQLKSVTGGQGSYVMDYSHDEQTPPNVQQELIASFKPDDEED
ncbi:MAG: elongation factor G [Planctomycetota bacterium]